MRIRPATIADIEQCERLDGSYMTDYVWQVDENAANGGVNVAFRKMRLPRRMSVSYPHLPQDLNADLRRHECFLVADELGTVYGFLDVTVCHWQWQGWVQHLVVGQPYRRQGIATQLLQIAERWARGSRLSAINVGLQSKNDPAICMLTNRGYVFRGFIDGYYNEADVALFYSLRL